MKRISIPYLVLVFIIFSCTNSTQDFVETTEEGVDVANSISKQKDENKKPTSDSFMSALNNFMDYNDSLAKNGHFDAPIIYVEFYSESEKCMVSLKTFHFYDLEIINGYFVHRNKMVAFLNPENACNEKLVNMNYLGKVHSDTFPDENSNEAIDLQYDPHMRIFVISENGKLTKIKDQYY